MTPCEWTKAHAFLVANGRAGTGESYAQLRPVFFFLQFVPLSLARFGFARSKKPKSWQRDKRPTKGDACRGAGPCAVVSGPCIVACAYLTDLTPGRWRSIAASRPCWPRQRHRGTGAPASYSPAAACTYEPRKRYGPRRSALDDGSHAAGCIKEERARNTTPTRVTVGEARIVVPDAVTVLSFSVDYVCCGI